MTQVSTVTYAPGSGGGGGGDVNLNEVAGTATDTGAGNSSAGTLRVVIASNQAAIPVTTSSSTSTTGTTAQVSIGTSITPAATVLASNGSRKGALVINPGPITVYIGFANTVTTATGIPLYGGSSFTVNSPLYTGGIFGVAASSTQTVGVAEFT